MLSIPQEKCSQPAYLPGLNKNRLRLLEQLLKTYRGIFEYRYTFSGAAQVISRWAFARILNGRNARSEREDWLFDFRELQRSVTIGAEEFETIAVSFLVGC